MTAREAVEECSRICESTADKYDRDAAVLNQKSINAHTYRAQAVALRAVGRMMMATVAVTP